LVTNEKDTQASSVNDRRRFDAEGNPKPEDSMTAEPAQETSPDTAAQATAQTEAEAAPVEDPELVSLRSELETYRRKVDELARAYQALQKDREEFKQRLSRERDRMMDVEKGNISVLVLEAIDELDRCLQSTNDNSPLAQGVRMIRDGLLRKVESTGIERLTLLGQKYDPNVAEATDMEMTTDPEEDQTILLEIQAGYRLKDRVIRPARVKVAKYVQPAQA
jgi:molecular chaperone GrpE